MSLTQQQRGTIAIISAEAAGVIAGSMFGPIALILPLGLVIVAVLVRHITLRDLCDLHIETNKEIFRILKRLFRGRNE